MISQREAKTQAVKVVATQTMRSQQTLIESLIDEKANTIRLRHALNLVLTDASLQNVAWANQLLMEIKS